MNWPAFLSIATGGCLLLGALFPYLFYSRALLLLPAAKDSRASRTNVDRKRGTEVVVSLLFAAYNEEASLPEKLENLKHLRARYPNLEVLAYDDGSSDSTFELLKASPHIDLLLAPGGRNGKAYGMRMMARAARGEILVFTDANVILANDSIANLIGYYCDPTVGGVAGSLIYRGSAASSTATVGGAYWALEERIKDEESRTGSIMGADGSIFSIRAELYPDFPNTVLDDFTVSMEVIFRGYRLLKAKDVVAFENLVTSGTEEFRRKVRIGTRAYHTHRHLRPRLKKMSKLDRSKYFCHKTLRWFGGVLSISGILLILVGVAWLSWTSMMIMVLAIGLLVGLSGVLYPRRIRQTGQALTAIIATQVGVFRALKGETVSTWTPSATR